jgi:hypothetical protein
VKECNRCKQAKPLDRFSKARNRSDGFDGECKECKRSRGREYTKSGQHAAWHREWKIRNSSRYLFQNAKKRAQRRGITFTLSYADVIVPDVCPVLGTKLEHGTFAQRENAPSLDRIDSKKGYIPGNVIVISYRANRLKGDGTPDELIRLGKFFKRLSPA